MNNLQLDSPRYPNEKDIVSLNLSPKEKQKKSELLSTNVSNKLIPNLSNPTNLTNPLIIGKTKRCYKEDSNENIILSNKDYKIKKLNEYNKLIFSLNNLNIEKIKSSKSELSLLNEGIRGEISKRIKTKKFLRPIETKRTLKESRNSMLFFNYMPKSINYSKHKINYNNMLKKDVNLNVEQNKEDNIEEKIIKNEKKEAPELDSIWEKLKNSKLFNLQEKEKRIDRTKFVQKYKYIEAKKQIDLIKYDIKIKNDRYNKIKNYNVNEIKTLDKVMNNLEKSSDYIQKNYQENYVSNVLNLSRQAEKEKIINSNILIDKMSLMRQITKLENNLNKINEEKNNILKWIYLQIKIKEKKTNLPLYYQDIIENKMNLDCIIKKYKLNDNILNEKEYNRIITYKNQLVFKDIEQIYEIYENLERKIFFELNKKLDNINNINELKNDLKKSSVNNKENEDEKNNNEKKDNMTFEEKEKLFLKELKNLKFKNNELNEEYSKIVHYKILLNDSHKVSFYNYGNSFIKYEKEGEISNLFKIAMNLYEEEIKGNFRTIENKIKWKYSISEEKIILDILIYTEKILNFLHEEKRYYNSDEKLKIKYKKISDEIEKETKNKKLFKQLELQERLLIDKQNKIQQRLNNQISYKPYRKVDFEYYLREKNKHKNKKNDNIKKDDNEMQYFFY